MTKRILLLAVFASIVSMPARSDDVTMAPTVTHTPSVSLPAKRDLTTTTIPHVAVAPAVVVSTKSKTDDENVEGDGSDGSVDCFYSSNQWRSECAEKNHAERH